MESEIRETLYFDETGIDNLYNSLGHGRLESFSREVGSRRDRAGGIKPNLGLGSALKILGGPTAELGAELSLERSNTDNVTGHYTVTREDRYRMVVEKLGGITLLQQSLDRSWHSALKKNGSSFFISEELFKAFPVDAENPITWLNTANTSQILQLIDSRTSQFRIGMSLDKIVGIRDGTIHPLSHLAVRLRGGDITLRVFGSMDRTRYIKPFVVWW